MTVEQEADQAVAAAAHVRAAAAADVLRVPTDTGLMEAGAIDEALDALDTAGIVAAAAEQTADDDVAAKAARVAVARQAAVDEVAEDPVADAEARADDASTAASVPPAELRVLRHLTTTAASSDRDAVPHRESARRQPSREPPPLRWRRSSAARSAKVSKGWRCRRLVYLGRATRLRISDVHAGAARRRACSAGEARTKTGQDAWVVLLSASRTVLDEVLHVSASGSRPGWPEEPGCHRSSRAPVRCACRAARRPERPGRRRRQGATRATGWVPPRSERFWQESVPYQWRTGQVLPWAASTNVIGP
ncbi:protein of unknown function [Modestobacter italicus]|uniref:Uncharacterized protein n=1 Tax=Modestobacter italicus (strain DSM 44449 / CECT 9708 / BC 501) TaxID=2732864 RepID=I4EYJ6_MODI5|nr:protein of unknown function [Modestobacter marinus]